LRGMLPDGVAFRLSIPGAAAGLPGPVAPGGARPGRTKGQEDSVVMKSIASELGLTQLAGREPYIWRVIGQNTPYMAAGIAQLGPNCVTPTNIKRELRQWLRRREN
jgi:hypothetical protein